MDQKEARILENTYIEILQPSSGKVLALYQAVGSLLAEGADLTGLKVAEIAARAGIGKGTTYDYFSSREELIVRAIQHNVFKRLFQIWENIEKAELFKDKVFAFLDGIYTPGEEDHKVFEQMFYFMSDRRSMPLKFERAFKDCNPGKNVFRMFCYKMINAAAKEGLCQADIDETMAEAAFISLLVSYGMMVRKKLHEKETMELDKVKNRLYENLIFALRAY